MRTDSRGRRGASADGVVRFGLALTAAYFPLRGLSDHVLASTGCTTAQMAVLRSLALGGPSTVPAIAAARPVARQAVQRTANELVARRLVSWRRNPLHKRSKLLALTARGEDVYRELERLQLEWAARLAEHLDAAALDGATRVLDAFRELTRREIASLGSAE